MPVLFLIFRIFVFLLGLCVGSFLNCVIYRLEQKKKITGRSYCPKCKKQLKWQDLFPVFSFLFLGGKCRYCNRKISLQYPLVEVAAGILFVLILSSGDVGLPAGSPTSFLNSAFLFYIASALIIIFVYDLKHYLIPDKVLFPAIGITAIYRILDFGNLMNYFWAVIIGAGFFLAIFLISKGRWMGFGDVKLAVLMGLLLGAPNILVALFIAFFFGAIIGLILIIFKGKNLKSEIPFGPFLIVGTFLAMLWGEQIINWYTNLFLF